MVGSAPDQRREMNGSPIPIHEWFSFPKITVNISISKKPKDAAEAYESDIAARRLVCTSATHHRMQLKGLHMLEQARSPFARCRERLREKATGRKTEPHVLQGNVQNSSPGRYSEIAHSYCIVYPHLLFYYFHVWGASCWLSRRKLVFM